MSRSPFGWDLPPGCTNADIDRAAGGHMDTCPDCEGEPLDESNCCGAKIILGDICSKCHEHCEPAKCETCEGTGEVDMDAQKAQAREDAEESKADMERDER